MTVDPRFGTSGFSAVKQMTGILPVLCLKIDSGSMPYAKSPFTWKLGYSQAMKAASPGAAAMAVAKHNSLALLGFSPEASAHKERHRLESHPPSDGEPHGAHRLKERLSWR
jgi:hypothetical protein